MSTNSELLARRNAAVARGVGHVTPLFAERAENAEVWDVEGRRYVDFAGGIGVLNTGHRRPEVMAAAREQMERFTHTCFQVLMYEPYVALAERLNDLVPISGAVKSIFLTTGAEAAENAIKIARAATGRQAVIALTGAFHGRTMLAMSLTGKVVPYRKAFGAGVPEIWHIPMPVEHYGVSVEDTLRQLAFLFRADVDPGRVAAIIVEPVQGEGGFYEVPQELMRALRKVCDEHGILLIADEVQTGFGRTGKLFAMEHFDVEADLICVAKSLAGGFPLSGVIGRARVMDATDPGGLGGTYAGNPIACAAALAVLDVIAADDLLERSNRIGSRIKARIEAHAIRNDVMPIAAVRGRGSMIAFDLMRSRGSDEPDAEATKIVVKRAYENGLILLSCGVFSNGIRVLVPLTASDEIVDEGVSILEQALLRDG
jgi:4-aminobutyrate aminotransferase/(S)-3-amino-2-methylpropionate transaminase